MLGFLWKSTRGYRFRPWRSPYLRWRIETYWGWKSDQISFGQFWGFVWKQRRELWRFLQWAEQMEEARRRPPPRRSRT